nr:winged helix-turn-helix domain-containing protein [Nocardiopsis halotolerans]
MATPAFNPRPDHYLWAEVARHITEQIDSGALPPGSRIPSERELAESLGVASGTVRKAIKALKEEGRLRGLAGKGVFVARNEDD